MPNNWKHNTQNKYSTLQALQWYQYKVFKQNTYNLLTLLIFPQTGQTEKSDGSAPHQNQYPPLQHS